MKLDELTKDSVWNELQVLEEDKRVLRQQLRTANAYIRVLNSRRVLKNLQMMVANKEKRLNELL